MGYSADELTTDDTPVLKGIELAAEDTPVLRGTELATEETPVLRGTDELGPAELMAEPEDVELGYRAEL